MMVNGSIPDYIDGYGRIKPFRFQTSNATPSKLMPGLRAAIEAAGLKDGGTISFHHHLRNGDFVINMVLAEIAAMGIHDITVAASSLFPAHAPMVDHMREGVVTAIHSAYIAGPVAQAVSRGQLPVPAVLQTHGGRARAIVSGELKIDVAFIAAPAADACGNLNGTDGPSACGTLGYAMVDAAHARCVVAVTDNLVPFPASPA
ncbi:citrate lyase subunit alpha, partial [Noviherbaspirillum denitrificans]|uniref:citrate lyase subunit alpha n=1 Tax=Noviherbaspirillum denitrificans TaxID=1968433 RepID=UPI002351CB95